MSKSAWRAPVNGKDVRVIDDDGPAELVMLAAIARRYYLQNQSKVEIADELGISRFKVARLLESARERGLVRIEIVRQGSLDVDASARLQDKFGLAHAVVVDAADADPGTVRHQLGRAAADLLAEVLVEGDVLGLPWSRNVHSMVASLTSLPRVEVVQLTGAIALPDFDSSAVDIVRRAGRLSGGKAHVFYAPFVLDTKASADAVRRQRAVVDGLTRASAVTKAVVGIGAWQAGQSTIHDLLDEAEQRDLASRGVIGELAGIFFDGNGKPLRPKVAARLITMGPDDLARIPEVIAVASGAAKGAAVRAALDGGLVHGLVVDVTLADVLLAD
jgi:DNA-binding transcriptional regulator LsrR (DeoR family)